MKKKNLIRVYRWQDAPDKYRALSNHGGDEDWVAIVPYELAESCYIPWLDVGPFGVCDVSEHHNFPGFIVFIGAHA